MNLFNLISLENLEPQSNKRYVYGKVENFDFLKEATSSEKHEYYFLETDNGQVGICKVINLMDNSKENYFGLVIKPSGGGRIEKSIEISNDEFKVFCNMSTKFMNRDTYFFDLDNSELKWKVDCFPSEEEGKLYSDNVRLTIRDWPGDVAYPDFPCGLLANIEDNGKELSEDESKYIQNLYETIFIHYNSSDVTSDESDTDNTESEDKEADSDEVQLEDGKTDEESGESDESESDSDDNAEDNGEEKEKD